MLNSDPALSTYITGLGWKAAEHADYVITGEKAPDEDVIRTNLGISAKAEICIASISDDVHFLFVGSVASVLDKLNIDYDSDNGSWEDSWGDDE